MQSQDADVLHNTFPKEGCSFLSIPMQNTELANSKLF